MSYTEITLPDTVPQSVRTFVGKVVNLYLADAYAMLGLPQPSVGITAGCGHPIVLTLTAVIGGVSRLFFAQHVDNQTPFYCALDFYPLDREPKDSAFSVATRKEFKHEIYEVYRNNLAHGVGLRFERRKDRNTGWQLGELQMQTKVEHWAMLDSEGRGVGRPETMRDQLDVIDHRPDWLPATLRRPSPPERQLLSVEALYWGVRVMVHALAMSEHAKAADGLFRELHRRATIGGSTIGERGINAGGPTQVSSTAEPQVLTTMGPSRHDTSPLPDSDPNKPTSS